MTTQSEAKMPAPPPGVHYDVPEAEYRAWDAVCNSDLDVLENESPLHLQYYRQHPQEPTPEMRFGSIFHALVLQPFDWAGHYAVAPDVDGRTKAGKEAKAAFAAMLDGREIVSPADYEKAAAMAHAVMAHKDAGKLLTGGRAEVCVVQNVCGFDTTRPERSVLCKGRMDFINGKLLVDLKSTANANPDVFVRSIWNYGYHRQIAFYLDLLRVATGAEHHGAFVAAEKAPPWAVTVCLPGKTVLEVGRKCYQRALWNYAHCIETGEWPAYPTTRIELPDWAIEQEMGL